MLDAHALLWKQDLDQLKQMHTEIATSLQGKKVAFIDIPLYYNVGDILIYLGTEEFINTHNIDIQYRAFQKNINHSKLKKVDTILFQGGGNFGDLYIKHQSLREMIIKRYPDKQIVMLPETIYFNSLVEQEKSAKVFRTHKDLTLYVRDTRSFDIAKSFTDNVKLMPDMAHSLHPLVDAKEVVNQGDKIKRILNLKRKDIESSTNQSALDKQAFDWINMLTLSDHLLLRLFKKMQKLPVIKHKLTKNWKLQSDALLFSASNYFLAHEQVHTDRLHGLILAVLLGRQVELFDNSYGKNSAYYQQWLSANPVIKIHTSVTRPE